MKNFLRIILFTVIAVMVGAGTRYTLRRFFPSLYGERKAEKIAIASTKSEPGSAIVAGTGLVPGAGSRPKDPDKEKPYPIGHLWSKRGNIIAMSDGSVLSMAENTEKKPRLERIQRYYIDYEGERMHLRPKLDTQKPVDNSPQGAGAKGAPDKPDGGQRLGDAPPVAVSASASVRSGPLAENSPVAETVSTSQVQSAPRSSNLVAPMLVSPHEIEAAVRRARH